MTIMSRIEDVSKSDQNFLLSKIYESVIDERNFFDEDNKSKNDLPSPRSRGPPHKNYMSLKISTEANLSLL